MPVGDTSTAAPDRAWQDGVDLQSVRTASDGVGVLGYVLWQMDRALLQSFAGNKVP